MKTKQKPKDENDIAVIDFETDPFLYGRTPKSFACGLRGKDWYIEFWGADCAAQALDYLSAIHTPLIIYAHNGGKFDFFYLLRYLENPLKIINGRIVKAKSCIHEFRDSWAIIPMALGNFDKIKIDYDKFEAKNREANRDEILTYLRRDCDVLYDLCYAFVKRFGYRLTIAGTAMRELQSLHPQDPCGEKHDERFRPYYFGGRVEAIKTGVVHGDFKVYDVNSMYPAAMRDFKHPIGKDYFSPSNPELSKDGWLKNFPGYFYFAEIECENNCALPSRVLDNNGGLSFGVRKGTFFSTSHEIRTALSLGLISNARLLGASIPLKTQSFAAFVDKFSAEKIAAKKAENNISYQFAKLIQNSAYGRFGINPRHFFDYHFEIIGETDLGDFHAWCKTWELYEATDKYRFWRKPAASTRYADVAIAASITSAARSILLRALHSAINPVYCDTDSIICSRLRGVDFHDSRLGAWKLEGSGNRIAIGGKKLYALFDGDTPIKWASKGVKLEPTEIERIANGAEFVWESDAPSFSLANMSNAIAGINGREPLIEKKNRNFTRRTVKKT